MILPWRVDVPQERRPVMNWLVIVATVVVFAVQINDTIEQEQAQSPQQPDE